MSQTYGEKEAEEDVKNALRKLAFSEEMPNSEFQ